MNCPNCKNEMAIGSLSSGGIAPGPIIGKKIYWQNEKMRTYIDKNHDAYYCQYCKMILVKW